MSVDVKQAVGEQLAERVVQPDQEWMTPEERLLLRFYRQLSLADQNFMRLAIEAMAKRLPSANNSEITCEG